MLLNPIASIKLPCLFQQRYDRLSHYLKSTIEQDMPHEFIEISDYFFDDFRECISEFYAAFEIKQLRYATKIIELFYSKWIEHSPFPDKLKNTLETAVTATISTLIVYHLSAELAYITHYSLSMSSGLILLFMTVGIKVTTAEWSSVGILSGGLFKCNIYKSNSKNQKITYKTYKY